MDALAGALRGRVGTPRELAVAVGCDSGESSFRRALRRLVEAGELVPIGSTRDRRYGPPGFVDASDPDAARRFVVDGRLLELVPCSAREFSEAGHKLGLFGAELGARKLALGLETRRDADGAWVVAPVVGESDRSVPQRPSAETFAHMASVANAHATKGVIAGRSKEPDR